MKSENDEGCRSAEPLDSIAHSNEKPQQKPKTKRGSSGLANLEKARARKMLRKERLKNLLRRRALQKQNVKIEPAKVQEDTHVARSDYFLGDRQLSPSEKLIIPLRLSFLVKNLHEGLELCKTSYELFEDKETFPTFGLIKRTGLNADKNPVEWTVQEVYHFINYISTVKNIALCFKSEDIDGEALLNLTLSDLVNHFNLDLKASENIFKVLSSLRAEVIKRYVNI